MHLYLCMNEDVSSSLQTLNFLFNIFGLVVVQETALWPGVGRMD